MKTETLVIGLLATAALGGIGYYVYVSTKKPEPKKNAELPVGFPSIPGLPMPVLPGQLPAQPAGMGLPSDLMQQGGAAAAAAAAAAKSFLGNPFGNGPVAVTPGPTTPVNFTPAKQPGNFSPLSFGALINPMSAAQVAAVVKPMSAREVQHGLNVLGAAPPLTEDGNYGPKSVAAVKSFQMSIGLTADGIVGPKTVLGLQYALAANAGMNAVAQPATLQGVLVPSDFALPEGVSISPDGRITFSR
jgi:hypothetical protein